MSEPKNVYDAAKAVAKVLEGMEQDKQAQILRWVSEDLDIHLGLAKPTEEPEHSREAAVGPAGTRPETVETRQDIKSFVESKSPKSDVQFATVVAYYYRFEAPPDQRRENLDAKTLQDATRLASRKRLAAARNTLNNAKKQGYLDNVGRGLFAINNVGENLVAMTLPGAPISSAPRAKKRTKPKRKKPAGTKKAKAKKVAKKPGKQES